MTIFGNCSVHLIESCHCCFSRHLGSCSEGGGVENVGTTTGSWGAAERLGATKRRTRGTAKRLGALLQWVRGVAKQLSASKQHVRRVVGPASSLIFSSH
jgi:hypothetical protein